MDDFQVSEEYRNVHGGIPEKEFQETIKYFQNHPLFMKEIPKNFEENQHLAAIQSIIYDEDPEVLAENLNVRNMVVQKQGNERLKKGPDTLYFMRQAYKKYTEGIHQEAKNPKINAKLHCNRAAINYKLSKSEVILENYGKVIDDCKMALKFDSDYDKAYFRYGNALIQLKRYEQCVKLLESRKQEEIVKAREEAAKLLEKQNKKQQQKQAANDDYQQSVASYCKQNGYKLKKRQEPLPEGTAMRLENGKLSIPIIIMYPEFSQFDLVQRSKEQDLLLDHVAEVISSGIPWDTEKTYVGEAIQVFIEVEEGVMKGILGKDTVRDALKRYTSAEAVELTVVSKKSKHYQRFCQENKIL